MQNGNNPVYDLISSDLVLNLDDVLSKDQGKTLYDAFPKNLWEMAKCDETYLFDSVSTCKMMREFMLPSTGITSLTMSISAWDGSIDGIYQILQGC